MSTYLRTYNSNNKEIKEDLINVKKHYQHAHHNKKQNKNELIHQV